MRKKSMFIMVLLLISFCLLIFTGCGESTIEQLKSEYGVSVEGGLFENGTILISNKVETSTTDGQEIIKVLSDKEYNKDGEMYIFDIYISKDGKKVQPSGRVKVTIPRPNTSIDNYVVFHIKENGEVIELIPTLSNDKLVIEVDSFSYFVICEKSHVHNYNIVVTDPTCTEQGYTTYTCNCGESYNDQYTKELGNTYDEGVVTKEPTHLEEGIKTYTCTECGRTKEETVPNTLGHSYGKWIIDQVNNEKHYRVCECGEKEIGNCTFDNGVITKEPTHLEEGIKTYTCTECGRTKEEAVSKTLGHSYGKWTIDQVNNEKHYRVCECGEKEIGNCTFDNGVTDEDSGETLYTCTECGRTKSEIQGIIIVIANGQATFEGKETVVSNSKKYGEKANVYIAQQNDVLNVKLNDQEGRIFKHWVSAAGTIIPDEDFSMLVLRSGYYYPIFEDVDTNAFYNREKVFEGNCEEGILYMSTNSKGDVKYELEFVNNGRHDFNDLEQYDDEYHKQVCLICGETIYEKHYENNSMIIKEPTHSEEGQYKYECRCGYEWVEKIPVTDNHSVDYNDWHIVEESKNGQYGKYRVYCKYCDYYEEYWYLNENVGLIEFIDGKMIHYQATYGGKVTHDEYYYNYRNDEGKKVYIWALQYEYDYSSNADYNDTYIFMYIDDEDSTTIEPVYLSKSKGDRRGEYLWAIYGYVNDANGWIKVIDSPDLNIGCENGMLLSNSMSARSSVFESYHNYWAETYNNMRIPTSKECNDLSDTSWEIYFEGKGFQNSYFDENGELIASGGIDVISYVKDADTSYKKYMHVLKDSGITYGFEDWGTYYRTIYIMRECKTIVSPDEYEKLDEDGKFSAYSYGNIETDIKRLCSKRNAFNNFTLNIPETISSFRLLLSDPMDSVELSGNNVNVYYNSAYVYNSGSNLTLTWEGKEDLVFDRYEIWDFINQKWILFSDKPNCTFNTLDSPMKDAAYIRVVCHKIETPIEPGKIYTITVENGYFIINDKTYYGSVEVEANTLVYVYYDNIEGKHFEHWLDDNGEEFNNYSFNVTSNLTLKPVYVDTEYNIYYSAWEYECYISVNGGESHYTGDFIGKLGDSFELTTTPITDGECNVFIGWYLETVVYGIWDYVFLSDNQTFTYVIKGDESGSIYAVWTSGENPFTKTYVDIRIANGFVTPAGGEISKLFDNAYSVISVSNSGRVNFYDNPTDEIVYKTWDIAFKNELEGETIHYTSQGFENEYEYYPADFWVDDPKYCYPDGIINVTGIINPDGDIEEGGEVILPS